jgi:hypothetical protein
LILKSIHIFLNTTKKISEKIAEDIESVRKKIKEGESIFIASIVSILSFLKKIKKSKNN